MHVQEFTDKIQSLPSHALWLEAQHEQDRHGIARAKNDLIVEAIDSHLPLAYRAGTALALLSYATQTARPDYAIPTLDPKTCYTGEKPIAASRSTLANAHAIGTILTATAAQLPKRRAIDAATIVRQPLTKTDIMYGRFLPIVATKYYKVRPDGLRIMLPEIKNGAVDGTTMHIPSLHGALAHVGRAKRLVTNGEHPEPFDIPGVAELVVGARTRSSKLYFGRRAVRRVIATSKSCG